MNPLQVNPLINYFNALTHLNNNLQKMYQLLRHHGKTLLRGFGLFVFRIFSFIPVGIWAQKIVGKEMVCHAIPEPCLVRGRAGRGPGGPARGRCPAAPALVHNFNKNSPW